ncbi:hypothetical protein LCGC14_1191490 [marine sediment metagenome]|uniref:Uncharacterized protein n=1 Tax=marine sediment metagenome TaxID=412755 RepID=A0A0F9M718_9ZZZZ
MSLKLRAFIAFMGLLVMVCGVGIVLAPFYATAEYIYDGKVVLRSEAEYVEFKEIVGRPDVDIVKMMVLSSEPPIVIVYRVIVPEDVYFPYEEEKKEERPYLLVLFLGAAAFAAGIYLVVGCVRNTLD